MTFARERRLLHELLVFASAAKAGTFSAAGREMGITQSAVSHCVARLERDLGLPLFTRHWRGATPNKAGEILLEAVTRGSSAMAAGVDEVRRLAAGRHSLTIVTDFGFASLWLLPRLDRLRSIAPGLDVHILTTRSSAELDLKLGDAVIAFGAEPPEGWEATPIMPEVVVPVASPALAAGWAEHSPEHLARAPLLHLDVPEKGRWIRWRDYFLAHGVDGGGVESNLTFDNYPLLIQAAIAGRGVALGWEPLISDLLHRAMLVEVSEPLRTGGRGYDFIIPRSGSFESPLINIRDWILREAGRQSSFEAG
jgi:DNA-binding transcriptional LysR family regulator